MSQVLTIAHDFTCPWCWIALHQARQLQKEFGVSIDWRGYELWPEELGWPEPSAPKPEQLNRPKTPTRIELAYAAQGMAPPTAERPKRMRIHNALEAAEYAREEGKQDAFVEAIYRALYERGERVGDMEALERLAEGVLSDVPQMVRAVEERRFADRIVLFDDPAYAAGVYYVPTFFIGEERLAEQPFVALRAAMLRERKLAAS